MAAATHTLKWFMQKRSGRIYLRDYYFCNMLTNLWAQRSREGGGKGSFDPSRRRSPLLWESFPIVIATNAMEFVEQTWVDVTILLRLIIRCHGQIFSINLIMNEEKNEIVLRPLLRAPFVFKYIIVVKHNQSSLINKNRNQRGNVFSL